VQNKQAGQTSWKKNEKQMASKKHVPPTGRTWTQHIINNFKTHIIIAVRTWCVKLLQNKKKAEKGMIHHEKKNRHTMTPSLFWVAAVSNPDAKAQSCNKAEIEQR